MKIRMIAPTSAADREPDHPPDGNTEQAEQPAADQSADDANDDVANQPEAAATHDQAGEPAGDATDHDKENETPEGHLASLPMTQPWMRCLPQTVHKPPPLSPPVAARSAADHDRNTP